MTLLTRPTTADQELIAPRQQSPKSPDFHHTFGTQNILAGRLLFCRGTVHEKPDSTCANENGPPCRSARITVSISKIGLQPVPPEVKTMIIRIRRRPASISFSSGLNWRAMVENMSGQFVLSLRVSRHGFSAAPITALQTCRSP